MSPASDGRSTPPPREAADGRVLRGERNREAIVDAIVMLIQDREKQPTAREVAERAGVQPRTVFRHFQDMETLNAEVSARVAAEVLPILGEVASEGNLVERVRGLVRRRAEVFERIAPFQRVARGLRPRSAFVERDHEELVDIQRRNLAAVVPEARKLPAPLGESLELLVSFEAWDRLRSDQRLSPNQARRAVEQAALALLETSGLPLDA